MRKVYNFILSVKQKRRKMASFNPKHNIHNIDGSVLEGGGQIIRMSMGFSALLSKSVKISNIRANRSKPGLKAQHLAGVKLIYDLTEGNVLNGAELNSSEIEYHPQKFPNGGSFKAQVGTAGSITLLAQISLPCLLFSKGTSEVLLTGGTDVDFSPQIDYMRQIFLPNLARFGASFECDLMCRGYFPKGGGKCKLKVSKNVQTLDPVTLLERGDLDLIEISSSVGGTLPIRVAEEMAKAAKDVINRNLRNVQVKSNCFKAEKSFGNGSSILIKAITKKGCVLGGSSLGTPKKAPFVTGQEAANEMLQCLDSEACVDQYMQDQLIIYMALAKGVSRIKVGKPLTLHTETAIHISEKFTNARFKITEPTNERTLVIECQGHGLES